jgi:hypothetical protein
VVQLQTRGADVAAVGSELDAMEREGGQLRRECTLSPRSWGGRASSHALAPSPPRSSSTHSLPLSLSTPPPSVFSRLDLRAVSMRHVEDDAAVSLSHSVSLTV